VDGYQRDIEGEPDVGLGPEALVPLVGGLAPKTALVSIGFKKAQDRT